MIEIRNVSKRYGTRPAVDDVTFSVAGGESVALWGTNGAGKTTLLRCLLGVTRYDGEITIDGESSLHSGKAARQRVGYVPQVMPTFDLSVAAMVRLVARLRGADPEAGFAHLETLRLGGTLGQSMGSLSGGMKQKVALALALQGNPPVLLLDEPTANLDARSQADLIAMLASLKQAGRTMVFTSHRWSEVRSLADRVVTLEQGKVIGIGAVADMARIADDVQLRIDLQADTIEPAVLLLRAHGFPTERHGASAVVTVDTRRKAEPLALLTRSSYDVTDFDVEGDA
jgi:ABC-type multidrug transport system ATPase subunit